jgi:aminopeptidase N
MMRAIFAGISMLLLAAFSRADTYLRQPSIDVVRYEISVELSDKLDSIVGATKVHIMMREDSVAGMWLDFAGMKVDALLVGGVERPFVYRNGRISFSFDRQYSRREIAVVEVRYSGKPENGGLLIGKNRYGRRVFFAENWPDRAHHWFPSVDHPSDKAAVDFAITAPEKYDVVANGRLIETRSLLNGRKLTRWSESKAIPTYSMVIGEAEFSFAHQASES